MPPRRTARRGRKAPMRKPNYRRGRVMRRRVAGIVHTVKRLGLPGFVQNGPLGPTLTATGNNSFAQGAVIASLLPGCYETGLSAQFKLDSVIDMNDFTDLFDRYKIVGVALKFHYLQSTAASTPGFQGNMPTIHYAFDGDDANAPTTANSVLVKGYCKTRVLNANRPTSVYIKPRITKEIYNSPITTGYSSEKACWLDCNSDAIPHFGLKVWISDWSWGADNNNALRIQPTYYLKLRDTQ